MLAENKYRYLTYERSVKQLAASRLRERGFRVTEVIEDYPEKDAHLHELFLSTYALSLHEGMGFRKVRATQSF